MQNSARQANIPVISLAVLISGGGTTLRNLIVQQQDQRLPVTFGCVVTSNPKAKGIEFASAAGIPVHTVERSDYASTKAFSDRIFDHCRGAQCDLIVMAGFLKHVLIPHDFRGRVINIHPSLIPEFCGKGFYGHKVHQAVIAHGARTTGCTVHFVDNQYDHGPIILQRTVQVLSNDTAESLANRVFEQECEALPEAIRRFAGGELKALSSQIAI